MKKKVFKAILISIILVLIIFFISPIVNAGSTKLNPEAFSDVTNANMGSGALPKLGGVIIYIVQFVGYTVAVLMLSGIGIKYMMAAPGEKADLKAQLIPYTIGAVLLFGGVSIISLIYDIVTK